MGRTATTYHPSISVRPLERGLAVLLVGLLATFAVGTVAESTVPAVYTAGVVAVHLAIVVGIVFLGLVLVHATVGLVRSTDLRPHLFETVTAVIAGACLTGSFVRSAAPYAGALLAVATGGALLLAGHVIVR